jgi:hypothetical protein
MGYLLRFVLGERSGAERACAEADCKPGASGADRTGSANSSAGGRSFARRGDPRRERLTDLR